MPFFLHEPGGARFPHNPVMVGVPPRLAVQAPMCTDVNTLGVPAMQAHMLQRQGFSLYRPADPAPRPAGPSVTDLLELRDGTFGMSKFPCWLCFAGFASSRGRTEHVKRSHGYAQVLPSSLESVEHYRAALFVRGMQCGKCEFLTKDRSEVMLLIQHAEQVHRVHGLLPGMFDTMGGDQTATNAMRSALLHDLQLIEQSEVSWAARVGYVVAVTPRISCGPYRRASFAQREAKGAR